MTPLRQQRVAALELNGKSPATVEAYVREVALVAKFYRKRPDLISEEELVRYLLHRKNTDQFAPTSMRICYSGHRFFYQRVLDREWKIFALLRARRELRRPSVLSRAEVHRVLQAAYPFHNQVYFTTVYSCGLRLHEGLHLKHFIHRSCGNRHCPQCQQHKTRQNRLRAANPTRSNTHAPHGAYSNTG